MSNKTPKASAKKTKLGLSATKIAVIAIVFAFILSLLSLVSIQNQPDTPLSSGNSVNSQCDGLQIKNGCYALERAETSATRTKGLSDRASLASQTGMLFVFDREAEQCIWMKDMQFDLDIVWLDRNKTINRIEQNVSPATYPTSFCAEDTQYVIELNKGEAVQLGLAKGRQLVF